MKHVIEVRDFTKRLGNNTILEKVNLQFQSGNIYGFMGEKRFWKDSIS